MQIEVYRMDAEADSLTITLEAVCDSFSSLLWDIEYYQCGSFEVYIAANPENLSIFQTGRIVGRDDDSQHFGIIESVQIDTDAENGDYLTVRGRFLMCLLERRITPAQLLRNWLTVYLGNAVGGAAVAALAVYSHTASLFGDGLARSMVSIAESKAALGFGDAFLRGVLCNFLVCLAVWMAAASKRAEGKVIALFFPILLFVLCGYEHCIANLYYLPAGAFAAAEYGMETTLTLAGCLKNLAAVTLGNLVGGAALGVGYRFAYLKE